MIRILSSLVFIPNLLFGQFAYEVDTSIPVRISSTELLSQPWAGGFNAVQFNRMDLNNDNQDDLVLYDRTANKILTYLSQDQEYIYAPEYELLFPNDLSNFVLLRDFNGDGRKDIFTGNSLGIKVYENITEQNSELKWRHYTFPTPSGGTSDVLLTTGFSGKINLQLQFDDLPSISDVDGDGDLDIVCASFSQTGRIEFHKNVSTTGGSLQYERITQAWGNFTECGCGEFAFANQPCNVGGRTKHAGGKSLLAIDVDNDAKTDLIFSESNCDKIYLLRNQGTSESAVFMQAEIFPADLQLNGLYPAAFFEDINFDGVKDILVSSATFERADEETNFRESAQFFKNSDSNTNLQLAFQQSNFLQSKMIDVGENAMPAFFDYDNDGDPDLFISNLGRLQTSQIFATGIFLFENIGSSQNPEFEFITDDFENLSSLNFYNLRLQFIDVNQDGKVDLAFTATDQNDDTSLYYLLNTNVNRLTLSETVNKTSINIFFNENIHITEINNDGLHDLLIGKSDGSVEYWKNMGPAETPTWQLESNSYLNLGTSLVRQNPSINTGDLNGDAKLDLILGDQKGVIRILSDFKSQTNFQLAEEKLVYNSITQQYEKRNLGGRVWATVLPTTTGGNPSLVVGNMLGGLQILKYKNTEIFFEVYPNPLYTLQKLSVATNVSGTAKLYNVEGKNIQAYAITTETSELVLPVLKAGIYLLRFTANNKVVVRRIVVY